MLSGSVSHIEQPSGTELFDNARVPGKSSRTLPWSIDLLIVVVVAACMFFVALGPLPLLEPDEGRNAEIAREMLASGDWITPHFDGLPHLDKPAIFYWLVAGSMRLFGLSEWSARLPSALMALATAVLIWLLAKRMFESSRDRPGLLAVVAWSTFPLVVVFAREVILDMTLAFLMTAALVCFWVADTRASDGSGLRDPWLNAGLFGAMGLATFVKGPIGVVLPSLSILVYLVVRGRVWQLRKLRWGLGLLVFLAAFVPWFVLVSIRNPAFPRYALWDETVLRFTSDHQHRSGGPFYYIPVFLGGLFPWSLCLLFGAWNRLRRWRALGQETHKAELFLLTWAGVPFLFFSLSHSKLPGYILPATIPFAILMACLWRDVGLDASTRGLDWLTATFAAMIAVGILVGASPQLLRMPSLQSFVTHKIPPNVAPFVKPQLFFTGVILAAIGVLGRSVVHRLIAGAVRSRLLSYAGFLLLGVTVPLLIVRWAVPLQGYAEAHSSRQLAREILASPERDMPIYGYYYFRTSLPFYLRHPVGLVTSGGSEITSNYVVAQFNSLRQHVVQCESAPQHAKRSGAGTQTRTAEQDHTNKVSQVPQVMVQQTSESVCRRVLIDGSELKALSASSPTPFMLLVPNRLLSDAARVVGSIQPLWSAWDYSVVEADPAGPASARHETPIMIDAVVQRKSRGK